MIDGKVKKSNSLKKEVKKGRCKRNEKAEVGWGSLKVK